jgi:hypothetical protein
VSRVLKEHKDSRVSKELVFRAQLAMSRDLRALKAQASKVLKELRAYKVSKAQASKVLLVMSRDLRALKAPKVDKAHKVSRA